MSEKFNDIIRRKINSLEEFPGGVELDTSLLWKRTEQQLPKKKNRSLIWWLAPVFAAAIIVYCFLNASWFMQPQQMNVIKETVFVKPLPVQEITTKQNVAVNAKQTVVAVASHQPSTIIVHPSAGNQNISTINVQPIAVTVPTVQLNDAPDSISAATIPTITAAVEKKAPPKKLKIIHLNELNTRPTEPLTQTEIIKANMQREAMPVPTPTPAWWSFKSRQQQTP